MSYRSRVIAYVDSDGKIAFNYSGDVELGGQKIINVTELTEVEKITNTTTYIEVEPADGYEFKVGDVIEAIRGLDASYFLEAADYIKNEAIEFLNSIPAIQGLKDAALSFIPTLGFNAEAGTSSLIRNFFGWGDSGTDQDLHTDSSQVTKTGGMWSRLGTGLLKIFPSSGYDAETGDVSNTRTLKVWDDVESNDEIRTAQIMMKLNAMERLGTGDIDIKPTSGYPVNATEDLKSEKDIYTPTGGIESGGVTLSDDQEAMIDSNLVVNIQVMPDSGYKFMVGNTSNDRNLWFSDDAENIDVVDGYQFTIKDTQGGADRGLLYGTPSLIRLSSTSGYAIELFSGVGERIELDSGGEVQLKSLVNIVAYDSIVSSGNPAHDIGKSSAKFNSVHAVDFYEYNGYHDTFDDLAIIRARRPRLDKDGNPVLCKKTGIQRLEYDSLPEWMVVGRKEGLPRRYHGIHLGAIASVGWGAIVQVDDKVEELKEIILDLQSRIEQLERGD